MDRNNDIKFDYSNLLTGEDSFLYNFRKGDIYHDPNVEVFLKSQSYKNIWLTSDLHLFKYTYEGTKTSEYYIDIMKRFTKIQKNKVKKNDVFIYLGDISYRHAVEDDEYITMINSFIKQLNGTKILVRGNHDLFNHNYYTEKMGFDFVTDYIQFNNLFLTHAPYPLDPDDNETINIHGHIHGDKKYMNMDPERHYDVYAFKGNRNITNLQDIIKEVNSEKYIAGELYLDPNWEYFEQAKKMYKDFKESNICCNTDRLIEEISKIKGSNDVEDLLIDNLLKDIEREDFNTPPLMDEYPYFVPDEMEDLGVFSDNPNLNCYDVVYRQEFLDDDDTIDSKAWYNEYKLFCKGIFTEKFENYLPLWRDKVRLLCEKLKHNPSNEIKQSLLELGWNPEVEFTDSNRIKATKRVKSFIESNYDNSNIYNLLEDKEEDDSIIEESYKEKLYPVYIVLSYTDTPFGRVCLKVTKGKYSHSGIALDADLKRIYTFTGDAKYGFAIENLDIYSQNCDDKLSKLGVYCVFVTKEDLRKIKIKLDYFLLNRYDFKYSYLGVLTLLMNKDVTFNNAMICSQFVSFILKSAGINLIGKADSLVQPDDYYKIKDKRIYLLYDGHIKAYDAKKIQKKVDKLAKTAYYVKESTIVSEGYDKPIKLYHGSPIQNLKYIEARKESSCKYIKDNDKHIFASPNKSFAACFGVKWNDDIARQGSWDKWNHTVMGIDFNKIDIDNSPCSIYELEPNTFKHLHGQEWVSDSTKVKVIKEIKYKSFREMLEKNGVIIISLDQYKKSVEQNRLILSEEKEFGIQFNDNGDLLIKNPKKINYREEYFNSHNLLIEYDKTNNIESIKYELARLWYLNCLLESKLYGKKLSKEDKKEFTIVRAKILNDFKKYIKVVNKVDKKFNFDLYYKQTPFSDKTIKINNSTIKYSFEKMKNVIKLL